MDDLKEDLLDTAAILKERLNKLGIIGWFLLFLPLAIWPVFYLLLAFGFVKLVISGTAALYLASFWYKRLQKQY